MFGLLDFLKIGVGAVAGLAIGYLVGHEFGTVAGRAALQSEQAVAAAAIEKARVSDDARLRSLPNYELCVRSVRSSGVSDLSACDVFRVAPERP